MERSKRLVVAISGASAPALGIAMLETLGSLKAVETHLILSDAARLTIRLETNRQAEEIETLADMCYAPRDLAAPVASGSFLTLGMVVIPCSMKTLAAVATGFTTDLISRAADVTLKERRRLVLVTRETPLSLIHLRNMVAVTEAGGVILPPVPAFYHRPKTIDDLLNHTVGKVLDIFGIEHDAFTRWGGEPTSEADQHAKRGETR